MEIHNIIVVEEITMSILKVDTINEKTSGNGVDLVTLFK